MNKVVYLFLIVVLAGCGRDEIVTYRAPKEAAVAVEANAGGHDHSVAAAEAPRPAGKGFSVRELPEGWTESAGSGMRVVSYSIEGTSIDFYLISLSMGDIPSNVNRWRGQIGLDTATAEEIAGEVETFEVSGHAVSYIELYNPDNEMGIIAAIIDLAPRYWYFTAKGTSAELKEHAGAIRGFLESIELE